MFNKKKTADPDEFLSKEEVFAKLNASAEKTLRSLQQAYEAGVKAGMSEQEEDQLLAALQKVQQLCNKVRQATTDDPAKPSD